MEENGGVASSRKKNGGNKETKQKFGPRRGDHQTRIEQGGLPLSTRGAPGDKEKKVKREKSFFVGDRPRWRQA